MLCAALEGQTLERAAAALRRMPQVKENIRVGRRELSQALLDEVERLNDRFDGKGRVLVRPSGTEPVIRVLAEAETSSEAEEACGTISALVRRELG
jgi:phosphoglucosamine mutase